jgi:murein L,D-transpeptidase YcbB/YkuD
MRHPDRVIKAAERKDVKLARPVPLYWVYVTAWATADAWCSSATTSTAAMGSARW